MSKKALQHLSNDPLLKKVIETTPLSISKNNGDVYGALVRSIISQQLSVKAAATIYKRFLDLFENNYPHHQQVINMEPETMREVGLSRQKSGYIKNVATFFLEEQIHNNDWASQSDAEIIKSLTQIKGVGVWTVEMILMFTLDRPDVLPVGDLGIQQAMISLYGIEAEKKRLKEKMAEIAEQWRPHRTLACKYLWEWKDS